MALRGTLTHWKTRLLASELGISPTHALGILEALWHVTAEDAPSGDIGRLSNRAIAMQMFETDIEPDRLIAALVTSGHLDVDPTHRLLVHDWHQHADYNTRRKLQRHGASMHTSGGDVRPVERHDGSSPVMTPHKSIPEPEPEPEVKTPPPARGAEELRYDFESVEIPDGLPTLAYARGLLETCCIPLVMATQQAAEAAINAFAKEHRIRAHQATERLIALVKSAVEAGERVDKFWLQDRKWIKNKAQGGLDGKTGSNSGSRESAAVARANRQRETFDKAREALGLGRRNGIPGADARGVSESGTAARDGGDLGSDVGPGDTALRTITVPAGAARGYSGQSVPTAAGGH